MSLAVVYSRAQLGIAAPLVTVEVHLGNGLPGLSIVGLPETAVKESKDRVRGALLNSRFEFPARRITINLAPADLPKDGGRFDLPIALGILAASGQVALDHLADYEFIGELALSGDLRPISGALPAGIAAATAGRRLIVPLANLAEAALLDTQQALAAGHLLEVALHLNTRAPLPTAQRFDSSHATPEARDLTEVRGQTRARRALEIAAAGGHSLLFAGPPGTGKSLLASRLPGILPPMNDSEALEAAAIASISAQGFKPEHWRRRPYRAPHHTASAVALVGGGSHPRPGEISLAHHGVLFLDELPEFDRKVLEVLREPLETGQITISRAARQAEFPARFQLIAAMNPCPCGYLGDSSGRCRCSPDQIQRYRQRISGPLLDRIDLQVEVPRLPPRELQGAPGETSAAVRARVCVARSVQQQRQGMCNARLSGVDLDRNCYLQPSEQTLLRHALERLNLSARAYHRILRVARTIADLDAAECIGAQHLGEAMGYRNLDRPVQ
ncbi:MAG: YifB family Mg chelatase-like AAA ATPase [Gammaproteobacteria bacterium]|nr:YifB family Mg chelatase-like AAA ATPase [Gammaproteobacteria bacterium]